MAEAEEQVRWLEHYERLGKEIVKNGLGKLTLNVGPIGKDQTSVFIECGKDSKRFIVDRYEEED